MLECCESLTILAVLALDARPWVQGNKANKDTDWDTILVKTPVIKNEEIPEDSIIGVIHNMGYWGQEGSAMISLNLFAVVILCSRPGHK